MRLRRHKPLTITKRIAIVCLISVVLLGMYLALLLVTPPLAPVLHNTLPSTSTTSYTIEGNRLLIPKLQLSLSYASGSAAVLDQGGWHRYPERGNPQKGGNFILAGHRFNIGLTPAATKRLSPFYYLNRLQHGDKIYVDFDGKRYEYSVIRNYIVAPTQLAIEAPSAEPKMTLYTCTLKGSADGREVIDAIQVSKNIKKNIKF